MTTLTLPGDIPGLLRVCSPVILPGGHGRGVVVAIDSASTTVQSTESAGMPMPCRADLMHLSLIDATGRAHAAWWLASTLDVFAPDGSGGWACGGREWYPADSCPHWGSPVSALNGLDRHDDTRLPDDSRIVDAEALRRVVLHVAGRSA
jgi:hypothetical protein